MILQSCLCYVRDITDVILEVFLTFGSLAVYYEKPHHNRLLTIEDLGIHRDRQRKATGLILCNDIT